MDEEIENAIAQHALNTPGGLTYEKRRILRGALEKDKRDELYWQKHDRDYVYGYDEFEQPIGNQE